MEHCFCMVGSVTMVSTVSMVGTVSMIPTVLIGTINYVYCNLGAIGQIQCLKNIT